MMKNLNSWLIKVFNTLFDLCLSTKMVGIFPRQNINNQVMIIPLRFLEKMPSMSVFRNILTFLMLLFLSFSSLYLKAQNAPIGCDKTYMIVGVVPVSGDKALTRSEVFEFGSGNTSNPNTGAITCSIQGGGAEGIVVDPDKNIAYMATCCNQSEIVIYDFSKGVFLAPIPIPGEDLLDLVMSPDKNFLYVTSYNGISKVSITTNTVVEYYPSPSFNNKTAGLWGIAIHPTTGNVYVSKNWNITGQTSTIEYVSPSLTGAATLLATAPGGFNYRGINFANDGSIWAVLASDDISVADRLVHYNSLTGAIIESYAFPRPTLNAGIISGAVDAFDLAFGPDGNLYLTSYKGDCVTKFDLTTKGFSTFIPYHPGVQGKSIAFVCGNLKCSDCDAPAISINDITTTLGTCTNFIPNNNGTATLSNLVYNATKTIEASIKEGETFGTAPIFGAGANLLLTPGATSLTFTGLKPATKYTIRIWSGSDVCFNDLTFTTPAFSSKVSSSTGSILCGPGITSLSATCAVGVPQWYNSLTSNTVIGSGNTFSFNASSTITFFVGCKPIENSCGVFPVNRTAVTISVNTTPAAPSQSTVAGGLVCGAGSLGLKATCVAGFVPVWYDSQISSTVLHTGSPFNVPVTATKTYFVACKDLISGCESPAGSRTSATATFSPVPNPVITTSTSPVCAGTNVTLSVTPANATYAWTGPNGFTSSLQNIQFSNIQANQGGIYEVEVSNGLCSASTLINVVVFDRPLGITATATNATCDQDLVKNDGTIKLTGFGSNLRYDISLGTTYTGGKLYATSTAIPANGVLRADVPNPTIVFQQYTVRVFNANDCFTDHVVTIQQVVCDCGVARCIPYTIIKTKTATKKGLIKTTSLNSGTTQPTITPPTTTPPPSSKITIQNSIGDKVFLNTNDLKEVEDWLTINPITEDIIVQFNTSDTYLLENTFAPKYTNGTNRVTFQGATGVRPIFDAQKKSASVWRCERDYTTLKNIELRNANIDDFGGAIIRADSRTNMKFLDIIVNFGFCVMRATTGVSNLEIDGFIVRNVTAGSFRINGENGLSNGNISIKNIKFDHSTGQGGSIIGTTHGYSPSLVLKFNKNWVIENIGSVNGDMLFDLGIIEQSEDIKFKNVRGLLMYFQNDKNISLTNCYLPSESNQQSSYMSEVDGIDIIHSQIKFSKIYLCSNFRKIRGSVFLEGLRGDLNAAKDLPVIEDNNLIIEYTNGRYIDFDFIDGSPNFSVNNSNLATYQSTKGQNTLFVPLANKAQVIFNTSGSLSSSSVGKGKIPTIIEQVTDDIEGVTRIFPTDVGPFSGLTVE